MKKNNLEDLFKDSFENFEADVNPGVWKNVQTGLKGVGLGVIIKMLLNKMGSNAIVAIVSSAAAVLATVFMMNGSENKTESTTPKVVVKPNVVAEIPKPNVAEIKDFLTTDNKTKDEAPVVKNVQKENTIKELETPKKDKKQIQLLMSDERIASISSSCVGGAVPLIINLSNIGNGKTNKWSFNDGTKPMIGPNPVKYFDEPGIYTITLTSTNAEGKTAVDSIKVEAFSNSSIVSNQKEFSPNGDGVNDIFAFQSKNIVNMRAVIYDKQGNIVYEYKGIDGSWDGKNTKGEKVKDGTYLYIITAEGADGKKFEQKGKVNVTR